MSLFNNLFGTSAKENIDGVNFTPLQTMVQLDAIDLASNTNPQLIFKHSTRCTISSGVLRKFKRKIKNRDGYDIYYLDLLRYRNLSNEIANRYGIAHQSPQLLQIVNGKAVCHASHYDILGFTP